MPAELTVQGDTRQARERVQRAAEAHNIREMLLAARALVELGRAADLTFCATVLNRVTPALVTHGHTLLKTFLVRSATVEPLLPALRVEAVLNGYVLDIQVGGYGSYMEELIDPELALARFSPDLACILLDTEEVAGSLPALCAAGQADRIAAEVDGAAGRIAYLLQSLRSYSRARVVLQGCVIPPATSFGMVGEANNPYSLTNALQNLNQRLAELCRATTDCVFFDVDAVAARDGKARWRDERMFLASRLPVAAAAFRPFAHALMRSASVMFRPARKVLCTDLDNTLWGGILGEDGPSRIATGPTFPGSAYFAYQQYLREIAARGVLLAITSKNNEADVTEAFRVRAADLALNLKDFVARKIGWNDKVDALRELAAELSLGLDAFVFVDDNPVECEAVRQHLPQVAVVEVPASEPWKLVPLLQEQWYFDVRSVTADDRNRTGEYRAQSQRAALSQNATSREDFLRSLGIVCTFVEATSAPLDRTVQLLAKTNQFNLTTRRYAAADVLALSAERNAQAVAVRVHDRFGDAGVVGLALARQHGDQCWLDTLLLSCRVIGRGIETALLVQVAQRARQTGARWLIGEYIETAKNAPCRDFYPEHGFTQQPAPGPGGGTLYRLDLAADTLRSPSWLTLEGKEIYERADCAVISA